MAQQTQAARAAEYWKRFMVEFPTVEALAAATPAAVLRAWRGLGYNRRAISLRQAAIAIVRDHDGQVPGDLVALERLPGVGPYTARAVAALAFGHPVGAIDVNVRRVLNRALGGSLNTFSTIELQVIADASVPANQPGEWTHALMDIGATFCKPGTPRCDPCPAQAGCRFAQARGGMSVASEDGHEQAGRGRRSGGSAGVGGGARQTRERPAAFETTSRWLRGRILDLLRDAPGDTWSEMPARIGLHDRAAIVTAVGALARDGLLERHPTRSGRARLPIQ